MISDPVFGTFRGNLRNEEFSLTTTRQTLFGPELITFDQACLEAHGCKRTPFDKRETRAGRYFFLKHIDEAKLFFYPQNEHDPLKFLTQEQLLEIQNYIHFLEALSVLAKNWVSFRLLSQIAKEILDLALQVFTIEQ